MKALLLAIVLSTPVTVFAQDAGPGPETDAAPLDTDSFTNAMRLAKGGDADAAEREIVRSNRAQGDTVPAHFEAALRLIQLAHDAPREMGPSPAVPGLVKSAIQHLLIAESRASDAQEKGSARALIALIQERYLGDEDSALASYDAALKLSPEHPGAKANSDRLRRVKRNLTQKLLSTGGSAQ